MGSGFLLAARGAVGSFARPALGAAEEAAATSAVPGTGGVPPPTTLAFGPGGFGSFGAFPPPPPARAAAPGAFGKPRRDDRGDGGTVKTVAAAGCGAQGRARFRPELLARRAIVRGLASGLATDGAFN